MGEAATAGAGRGGVDLTGAEIRGDLEGRNPPIFLPRQPAASSPLLALDIGGTLIKLVYTASCGGGDGDGAELRFAKFERRRLHECFDFVRAKGLLGCNGRRSSLDSEITTVSACHVATGDKIKQRKCGAQDHVFPLTDTILQNVPGAAFTHMNGQRNPVDVSPNNLFPYLLVNIGSGVSILKVTGNKKFERVTGTHIGGGTMFGLAKLLTGCKSYDEFLQLSQKGDNFVLDLIVKDICGELVCQKQGLSTSTLASSFGKVITSKKGLTDYKPEDLASTLLSAFTYNIAQVSSFYFSCMHIMKLDFLPLGENIGKQRNIFINSWISVSLGWQEAKHLPSIRSQRQMQAVFLRHEGYLGALGALMSYGDDNGENVTLEESEDEPHHESAAPVGTSADEENENNIFPYLLVNIGSGVSMIEIGLPASTTAASFGKVNSSKLSDYKLEDLAAALLNSFTYNIGQIAYFVANLSGLKRIFFRGAYVCGHEKTMDKISRSLKYWSKGEVQTTFLCHEGFLGTLGAFWSYENMGIDGLASHEVIREVLLGAPYTGQFPSLPVTEQQNGENNMLEVEVERLRNDNAALKAEVERLQRENAELRAKFGTATL
nr:unnamed protein product [Digitaria exilis]